MVDAGQRVVASMFTDTRWDADSTTLLNVSGSDQVGSPEVGTTFIAPSSGIVEITVGGGARSDAADGDRVFMQPDVYEGSSAAGTPVSLTEPDSAYRYGNSNNATNYMYGDSTCVLSGLTPGVTYYARHIFTVSGSTGGADIFVRKIIVRPVI